MKSHEQLRKHWQSRQSRKKSVSLRYLARKLAVSPAYLSKIFSGQKPLPLGRARALAKELELDTVAVRALERALLRERGRNADTQENLTLDLEGSALPELPSDSFDAAPSTSALEEWYYLPILDLVTCRGFEPRWISKRLGLREEVAGRAWNRLQDLGWVENRQGRWTKIARKIRFPSHRIDPSIQRHHTSMLKKAAEELQHRKLEEDFARRLILGASVATNEESFRKAEKYLEEALYKAASILAEGTADRVYYLAFQLFPLTKR
ncbi:MAG: DUF4423 domain-containing protein [Bdellovibrionota bacterium]